MANHPIESLMKTAMESIQGMVDVNTIVGDPVETQDGSVIIPITKVACGFAAGGSEFAPPDGKSASTPEGREHFPFGGGSGAGVSVQPVGFLVVGKDQIRLLPIDGNVIVDRILDTTPSLIDKLMNTFKRNKTGCDDKVQTEVKEKIILTDV